MCKKVGRGGGQVVSVLAIYFHNLSSNHAKTNVFSVTFVMEKDT